MRQLWNSLGARYGRRQAQRIALTGLIVSLILRGSGGVFFTDLSGVILLGSYLFEVVDVEADEPGLQRRLLD